MIEKMRVMTVEEQDKLVLDCGEGLALVAHLILSASAGGTWCLLDWPQIKQHVNELVDLGIEGYEGPMVREDWRA